MRWRKACRLMGQRSRRHSGGVLDQRRLNAFWFLACSAVVTQVAACTPSQTPPVNAMTVTGWCDTTPMKPVGRIARLPDVGSRAAFGALTGVVVQAETGDALESAGVRIVAVTGDGGVSQRERATDAAGGFTFDSVVPGSYALHVRRLGETQDSANIHAIAGRIDTIRVRMRAYRCYGY
jgi:hypothetical protein